MRVVLDTNILISALLSPDGSPASIYDAWTEGGFTLVVSPAQIAELRAVLRKPKLAKYFRRAEAGRMVNDLRALSQIVRPTKAVRRSMDPNDDFLLELVEAGDADYLVTGDKSDLLSLVRHGRARIVSAAYFSSHVLRRLRQR